MHVLGFGQRSCFLAMPGSSAWWRLDVGGLAYPKMDFSLRGIRPANWKTSAE